MYVYVNIFVEVFVFHCLCATIVRWARNFYFMSVNELLLFVFDVIAVVGRWWFFFLISFLFFQLIHVLFHAHSEPFCFNTSNAKYPHNFNACTTKIAHIWFVVLQFRLYGYSSSMFACIQTSTTNVVCQNEKRTHFRSFNVRTVYIHILRYIDNNFQNGVVFTTVIIFFIRNLYIGLNSNETAARFFSLYFLYLNHLPNYYLYFICIFFDANVRNFWINTHNRRYLCSCCLHSLFSLRIEFAGSQLHLLEANLYMRNKGIKS